MNCTKCGHIIQMSLRMLGSLLCIDCRGTAK